MNAPIPPAPFPRKRETARSLRSKIFSSPPPWGGPAEAT